MYKPSLVQSMAYQNLPNNDLLILIKASSELAFYEVFRRYQPVLLLFAYPRVDRDIEKAEDLICKVFALFWHHREKQNTDACLRTSLINILKDKLSETNSGINQDL